MRHRMQKFTGRSARNRFGGLVGTESAQSRRSTAALFARCTVHDSAEGAPLITFMLEHGGQIAHRLPRFQCLGARQI